MYDNVCKFIAKNFRDDLVTWLMGTVVGFTELKPTELSNEPIRADSLILLQSENLVLHIEFQTDVNQNIPFRMLDYRLRVYRLYPEKYTRQIVIYLRQTNSELARINSFRLDKTIHEFEVIRLWQTPTEELLQYPGLLPFATLSKTEDPIIVLNQVAEAIETVTDRREKSNLTAATAILANLVIKEEVIKTIDLLQKCFVVH